MRLILNAALAIVLGTAVSAAYGDWPASKTYQADTDDAKLVTDVDGEFPGWVIPGGEMTGLVTRTLPGTIGGSPAEQDVVAEEVLPPPGGVTKGKLKYSTSGQAAWTFNPGIGVTTAIKWRVYIDSSRTTSNMPAVQIGNGTWRYQLTFNRKVAGEATTCPLSGWVDADNTTITAGGRRIPNSPSKRYLPMSMDAWHTIRFQVSPDGAGGSKFDAWIDEDQGLSDWNHVSGTTTRGSGSTYVQWGVLSSINGSIPFATSSVAWGQDAEIPAMSSAMEMCSNGIDDDGDGNADCADSSCDCSAVPSACGGISNQIFENFNVYFTPDPAVSGRVPPNWQRAGYSVPGYSDGDPTSPPGASLNDLTPFSVTPGPYYFFTPGPYVNAENDPEIKDMVVGQCIDDCVALGNTEAYCGAYCTNPANAGILFRPTQPLRMTLDLYKISEECLDKGGTNESCYSGSIIVQRQVKADDLAALPIDWSAPVTVTVSAGGIDAACCPITVVDNNGVEHKIMDGSTGIWETTINYGGYVIVPDPNATASIEWGADGDAPNYKETADYRPLSITLAANQGNPPGPTTLSLAVNFDYTMLNLGQLDPPLREISTALFENVRISYLPDLTKPVIQLNKVKLRHDIDLGEAIPDDTFTIANGMTGTTLNYTATDDADWLTLVNATGASTGEADPVTVQYNTAGLSNGIHRGTITVSWPGMDKSPATIAVVVQVGPKIELTTTALNRTVMMGKNVTPDTFSVINAGAGHLEYTISDDADWLSVSPSSFTPPGLANGEANQITITYDTSSLLVGTYNATITVSDPDATPTSETIDVRVVITLTRPDFDGDNDVDHADFAMFQACFSGAYPASAGFCNDLADLNDDEYVDAADNVLFEGCASGAGVPFNHDCLP